VSESRRIADAVPGNVAMVRESIAPRCGAVCSSGTPETPGCLSAVNAPAGFELCSPINASTKALHVLCLCRSSKSPSLTGCDQYPNIPVNVQVVNEDGALAWSPIVMHPSFHADLPPIAYLRMTTSTGQVHLATPHNRNAETFRLCFDLGPNHLPTALPTWSTPMSCRRC
jgi:hypothetical protein